MNDDADQIKRVKLKGARERCRAIAAASARFQSRIESSPATRRVVELILKSANSIEQFIDKQASDSDLDVLTADDLEKRIHRVTRIIPMLHWLLGIVEHSDVTSVPAELASPLRREIQKLFPNDAELILTSAAFLNYSIQHFTRSELQTLLDLSDETIASFPAHLFVASLPSIEYDQALLHCIFGHEISHPLWNELDIESQIPPFQLSKPKLLEIAKEIKKTTTESQAEFPFESIARLAQVPNAVQAATNNWCREFTSDLFGLILFGPAFVLTSIHFFMSFGTLDAASLSTPFGKFDHGE